MNVNPFSYLIEKLKSKADKTDLIQSVPFSATTDSLGLVSCSLPSASCKVVGVETSPGFAVYNHDTGTTTVYVSIENYAGVKQTGLAVTGTVFYIE